MKKLLASALLVLSLCTFTVESNAYCGYSRCWYRPRYVRTYHRHYRHHRWYSCRINRYNHFRRYY